MRPTTSALTVGRGSASRSPDGLAVRHAAFRSHARPVIFYEVALVRYLDCGHRCRVHLEVLGDEASQVVGFRPLAS